MAYCVETFTLADGWTNCWSVDGEPETFPTEGLALEAIREHVADCEEFGVEGEGPYRVVPV